MGLRRDRRVGSMTPAAHARRAEIRRSLGMPVSAGPNVGVSFLLSELSP